VNSLQKIIHQPLRRIFWLMTLALLGLVFSQAFVIMQGAEVRKIEFEEHVEDLLLDIHHNVEDDPYMSKLLIEILSKREQGLTVKKEFLEEVRSKMRHRIDSLANLYDINLMFDFVIFHTGNHQYYFKSSDNIKETIHFQEKSIKAGWRIKKELGKGKYRIGLHFYNEFLYILIKLKFILLFSFFIILMLSFSMWRATKGWKEQKELVELKNDFINNLTHELKTPIFSVSLLHKVIKKRLNGRPYLEMTNHLELLEKENEKLKERVEKVLDIALIENHQINLNLERTDVHQFIPEALSMQNFYIKQQQGKLVYQFNAEFSHIMTDQVHFANIINNIVDNAIKYCEKIPEIVITTQSNEKYLYTKIKDNGIGIDKDIQNQVFDKFYRVPTGNIHNIKGFGLGLSYTKMMVEAHNGKITINSLPDAGSEFILKFQLSKNHEL